MTAHWEEWVTLADTLDTDAVPRSADSHRRERPDSLLIGMGDVWSSSSCDVTDIASTDPDADHATRGAPSPTWQGRWSRTRIRSSGIRTIPILVPSQGHSDLDGGGPGC